MTATARPGYIWSSAANDWIPIIGSSIPTPHASTHTAGGSDPLQNLTITPTAANQKPLIVKGAAAQSANLQEWQGSSATVLANVTKDGYINAITPPAADLTTKAATTAWAAERATIGNLLTTNQANACEDTTTTGFTAAWSISLASTTDQYYRGTRSLQFTTNNLIGCGVSIGSNSTVTNGTIPVDAGRPYTFVYHVRSDSQAEAFAARIYWWQANGTSAASTASIDGVTVTTSTSAWKRVEVTGIAPANAVYAGLYVRRVSGVLGTVHYVDAVGFWAGAGGTWQLPGVPITDLGSRYNAAESCVEHWDIQLATWVQQSYRNKVGNLLTTNQASGTDALGTIPSGESPAMYCPAGTMLSSTAQSFLSTRSFEITSSGGSTGPNFGTNAGTIADVGQRIIATPGSTYTFTIAAMSPTVTRVVNHIHYFYNSAGAVIGTSTTTFTALSSTWQRFTATVVAPALTAFVGSRWYLASSANGEVSYWDACGVWQGAGGEWALPGTPIVNTGRRVTHPNTDDVLVEVWDPTYSTTGRWATVRYDSGWRGMTPENGWTASSLRVRRTLSSVQWVGSGLNGTGASSDVIVAAANLPTAFCSYGSGWYIGSAAGTSALSIRTNPDLNGQARASWNGVSLDITRTVQDAIPTSLPGTLISAAPA